MTIAREEIFGPVLCVIPYDDDDDAVRIANDNDYGLSGGVFSADTDRATAIARRMRTGSISVNGGDLVRRRLPYGGYKTQRHRSPERHRGLRTAPRDQSHRLAEGLARNVRVARSQRQASPRHRRRAGSRRGDRRPARRGRRHGGSQRSRCRPRRATGCRVARCRWRRRCGTVRCDRLRPRDRGSRSTRTDRHPGQQRRQRRRRRLAGDGQLRRHLARRLAEVHQRQPLRRDELRARRVAVDDRRWLGPDRHGHLRFIEGRRAEDGCLRRGQSGGGRTDPCGVDKRSVGTG